jgi:hypothetical protein
MMEFTASAFADLIPRTFLLAVDMGSRMRKTDYFGDFMQGLLFCNDRHTAAPANSVSRYARPGL